MTIGDLYVKMGALGLYDLRDSLLSWRSENGYNLKTEIDGDVLEKLPNKFIIETRKAVAKLEIAILEKLGGANYDN